MPRDKKAKKNYYFTSVHEEAIVEYCLTDCSKKREELYIEFIQPAFSEMVDKIIYTYKFTNIPNIDILKEDCKVWLTTILSKYDPNRGSKAFSYFSVITKHWFIHKFKKNSTRTKREIPYDDIVHENMHERLVYTDYTYLQKRSREEFWLSLKNEVERWQDSNLFVKENEKKVLAAVKILLDNVDKIDILNKKAVYLYLREITGLKTKQIVNTLNKMRERYKYFIIKYDRGDKLN
tara:strand:+ start:415 stop:1119 length:705 start_codon:yes stop_codon:yes gene_type:complete